MTQHCTACDDTGHKRSNCPRVFTCRRPPVISARWSETYALRDAVWEQLSFRFPKTPQEVFAAIRDDWGSLDERRLWRALQWNVLARRVQRTKAIREERGAAGYTRRAA